MTLAACNTAEQPVTLQNSLTDAMQATRKILEMKHYQKLGEAGIFIIVSKATSIGIDVLEALNGGMYVVNGKVELSATTMNYLIRSKGHSISIDPKSDDKKIILRGKRADNGDEMLASFSIDDAKRANIYKGVWLSYPEDMLFARALSRLARRLFPDVIKGCYVEGEIADFGRPSNIQDSNDVTIETSPATEQPDRITEEQYQFLNNLMGNDTHGRAKVLEFLEKKGFSSLRDIPPKLFQTIVTNFQERIEKLAREKQEVEQ